MSGAYHVKLAKRVHAAIARAENFLLGQVTRSRPGWGAEPGKDSDPWTTGQLCSLFARSAAADGVPAAVIWLRDVQNEDGSWGSAAHGPDGDTPARDG